MAHHERHRVGRAGWLRATVLGANDGIVSVSSLVLGVAGAEASVTAFFVAGIAGLVGGALSMAVGEYVSVSSQADTEGADLARERAELIAEPERELQELAQIWEGQGLDAELAQRVATRLHEVDALKAHLRDELGITEITRARPLLAAAASAVAFAVGGALPLVAGALFGPNPLGIGAVALVTLALLGGASARLGGAPVVRATLRVVLGGALAMGLTFGIGQLVGVSL